MGKMKLPKLWSGPAVKVQAPTVHPSRDVPKIEVYGHRAGYSVRDKRHDPILPRDLLRAEGLTQAARTNWPEIPRVQKELKKGDARSKKHTRRARPASALLAIAKRDAEAHQKRCQVAEALNTTVAKLYSR